MKGTRHPHPHKDPRQPRDGSRPATNPPVFVWKPRGGQNEFRLVVARDEGFEDVLLDEASLREPAHLPEKAFEPGTYFWKWSSGEDEGEVFSFEIAPEAVVVEVPQAGEWLDRLPEAHPRIFVRPEDLPALRESRESQRADLWEALKAHADGLIEEAHEYPEPPFLPDRSRSYKEYFDAWHRVLVESRKFVQGAEALALAYLASGEKRYARAACRRMASVSEWDPEGSSHISHNDEAHMSVVWHGAIACDWAWDEFSADERARVIEQFRRRGRITYDHMHDRGSYGVTRFDSHAGREIVFLALIAFVFHEQIPEAREWLDWLRPVLCGIWPIWAGDDGGWAEGPSYGLWYVEIMTMFATALKRGAGVDLYRRAFWKNHAGWREHCFPPYAEWVGFGDGGGRAAGFWRMNADLVELIGRETGTTEFAGYVAAFREEAGRCEAPGWKGHAVPPQRYLAPPTEKGAAAPAKRERIHAVFPGAGWAAIRTEIDDPSRDVAFIFRSSPLGAVSHSHANNNDFILHVAGKVMAMPSGYYDGYGSDHHAHWVWHTKSHNCVTLSDASQLMRSHDSRGAVENAFEDDALVYFRGNADASYSDRAERCRRHVCFLKAANAFVLIDEFVALTGVASALQWNIHSRNPIAVDERGRTFLIERDGSSLEGHFVYHHNAFFSVTEGWDPPPSVRKLEEGWPPEHHLRFTTSGFAPRRNLGVVLCPGHASLARAKVRTERSGDAEVARIGDDLLMVNQAREMEHEGVRTDALAILVVDGRRYELRDEGLTS